MQYFGTDFTVIVYGDCTYLLHPAADSYLISDSVKESKYGELLQLHEYIQEPSLESHSPANPKSQPVSTHCDSYLVKHTKQTNSEKEREKVKVGNGMHSLQCK